jgi:hypothetical protein
MKRATFKLRRSANRKAGELRVESGFPGRFESLNHNGCYCGTVR